MDTSTSLPRKGVFILGPERSGTSLTASVVGRLGAFVNGGQRKDQFNPRGYWEDEAVVSINERLHWRIGVSWTWTPAPQVPWVRVRSVRRLIPEAVAVLNALEAQPRWACKDPKFSVTLPFWKPLLPAQMGYLICLRNPLSVARSLANRNGLPISTAGLYWSNRMVQALVNTAGESRMIVPYEDFFTNGADLTNRIADFLGWARPTTPIEVPEADLDHGRATVAEVASSALLPDEARSLYLRLRDGASDAAAIDGVTRAEGPLLQREGAVEAMLRIYAGRAYNLFAGRVGPRVQLKARLPLWLPGER